MKKLFILSLLAMCASITVCSAADIEVTADPETGKVSVSGNPGEHNAEKKMMLYALKEGDSLTELNPDETQKETDIISAIEYCEAESDGTYSFLNVSMRSADDRYIFYVTADHSDVMYVSEPIYVTSKDTANTMKNAFENKSASEIKTELKNKTVKIDAPILNLVDDDIVLEKVAEKLANREYKTNAELVTAVNTASFETAMENTVSGDALELLLYPDKNAVMKDYAELARSVNKMSEKSELSTFKYIETISDSEKGAILDSVSKTGYSGSDDMFDKINMAVIMHRINGCSGYGGIKDILSEHEDAIEGFSYREYSTSNYVNDLNKAIMKKDFVKTKELSDYITKYLDDRESSKGSGGSSGGSSGGGSSSGNRGPSIIGVPVTPPAPVLEKEEENDDKLFTDIADVEWAGEAINYLAEKGVLSGKGDKIFAPSDNVKREEFVKMLVLAFDLKNEDNGDIAFSDVNSEEWYVPYIKTAYGLGIVNGISEDEFGIGSYISRQDMAVMITRAKNIELTDDMADNTFTDAEQVSDYARQSVGYLKNTGVINGYSDGSFKPLGNVTRAETAKVLYGLIK